MVLVVICLAIGFGISASNVNDELNQVEKPLQPSADDLPAPTDDDEGQQGQKVVRQSVLGNYSTAAISTDGGTNVCPQIGK